MQRWHASRPPCSRNPTTLPPTVAAPPPWKPRTRRKHNDNRSSLRAIAFGRTSSALSTAKEFFAADVPIAAEAWFLPIYNRRESRFREHEIAWDGWAVVWGTALFSPQSHRAHKGPSVSAMVFLGTNPGRKHPTWHMTDLCVRCGFAVKKSSSRRCVGRWMTLDIGSFSCRIREAWGNPRKLRGIGGLAVQKRADIRGQPACLDSNSEHLCKSAYIRGKKCLS